MLTFAALSFIPMLILAIAIIVPGGRRNTLAVFNPGETSLFGVTGGGCSAACCSASCCSSGSRPRRRSARNPRPAQVDPTGGAAAPSPPRRCSSCSWRTRSRSATADGGREGRLGARPGRARQPRHAIHRLVVRDDHRPGRDPRRDCACARDLRHHRPRLLRPRPRRSAAVVLREDLAAQHTVGRQPRDRHRRRRTDPGWALQPHPRSVRPAARISRPSSWRPRPARSPSNWFT